MRVSWFDLLISLMAGVFICLISLPLMALFTTTSLPELTAQLTSPQVLSAVCISFQTSLAVVFLSLFYETRDCRGAAFCRLAVFDKIGKRRI